jgi:hypothetical protein
MNAITDQSLRTLAAGRIVDVMTGGKFNWRSRLEESDFLESGDWLTALAYADAALATPPSDHIASPEGERPVEMVEPIARRIIVHTLRDVAAGKGADYEFIREAANAVENAEGCTIQSWLVLDMVCAALRHRASPSGEFALVPRVPTQAMLEEGSIARGNYGNARQIWEAMLSATPSPAQQSGELREALLAGLRSFCSMEPDFSMSRGMMQSAADHILAQPLALASTPPQSAHQPAGAGVAELREALEPFTRQRIHKSELGSNGILVAATVADVRRAKAALDPETLQKGDR